MATSHVAPDRFRVLPPLAEEAAAAVKVGEVLRCRVVDRSSGAAALLDLRGECLRAFAALVQSAGWWFINPVSGADLLHVHKADGSCALCPARPAPIFVVAGWENFENDPCRNLLADVPAIHALVETMRSLPMGGGQD